MIRPMVVDDVETVVGIHLASFSGFFLSSLGTGFLKLYYKNLSSSKEGLSYVFLNSHGEPVGFVAGTTNPQGYYSRLLKREWLNFALVSLWPICRNPLILPRILRALLHPGKNPPGLDVAGLFSIAVLPDLQGSGAGKQLAQKFLEDAAMKNCKKVFLTTDQEDNDIVNKFYKSLGFTIEHKYKTPEGRMMNEYWIDL